VSRLTSKQIEQALEELGREYRAAKMGAVAVQRGRQAMLRACRDRWGLASEDYTNGGKGNDGQRADKAA